MSSGLACTRKGCQTQEPTRATCTPAGGETVEHNWRGRDTGSNCCNRCRCRNGGLACTRKGCAGQCGGNAAVRESEASKGGVSTGVMAGAGAGLLAAVLAAAGCIVAAQKRRAGAGADMADSLNEALADSKKPVDV